MASEASIYLANALINHMRGTPYSAPATLYVGLNTSDPTRAGNDTEVAVGGGYARLAMALDAAASGATANTDLRTWTSSGFAGTITHITVWDASTVGNMLWSTPLDAPKIVANGDTVTIPIGDFDLTM